MSTITKTKTIDLSSGTNVEVEITVNGCNDPNYGADIDGNRGTSVWFIDSHSYELTDEDIELTSEEEQELDDEIEKIVYESEEWDFEEASEDYDDDDDYEDDYEEDENEDEE